MPSERYTQSHEPSTSPASSPTTDVTRRSPTTTTVDCSIPLTLANTVKLTVVNHSSIAGTILQNHSWLNLSTCPRQSEWPMEHRSVASNEGHKPQQAEAVGKLVGPALAQNGIRRTLRWSSAESRLNTKAGKLMASKVWGLFCCSRLCFHNNAAFIRS